MSGVVLLDQHGRPQDDERVHRRNELRYVDDSGVEYTYPGAWTLCGVYLYGCNGEGDQSFRDVDDEETCSECLERLWTTK